MLIILATLIRRFFAFNDLWVVYKRYVLYSLIELCKNLGSPNKIPLIRRWRC